MYGVNHTKDQFWLTADSIADTQGISNIDGITTCEDAELMQLYIKGCKEALSAPV